MRKNRALLRPLRLSWCRRECDRSVPRRIAFSGARPYWRSFRSSTFRLNRPWPHPPRPSASSRSAARRRWSIPSASSRDCVPKAMRSPTATRAPIASSVNTCGFIDSAKAESLEAIGTALAENGKVIVTGCMGAQPRSISERFPDVLSITGPQAYESVVAAVHRAVPPAHDPKIDLVPPQGIKLTPRHYAYLKISEGCNNRCSFCIIPSLRGRLVSRPLPEVMREAERLVAAGVKELLVISQDTSAYGLDRRHEATSLEGRGRRNAHPRSRARPRLARSVGASALRLPLPSRRRARASDGGRPDPPLSRHSLPARLTESAQDDAPPGGTGKNPGAALALARNLSRTSPSARPSSWVFPARRRKTSRSFSAG